MKYSPFKVKVHGLWANHDILQTIGFSLLMLTCTPKESTMGKKIASYASSPKAKETIFANALKS